MSTTALAIALKAKKSVADAETKAEEAYAKAEEALEKADLDISVSGTKLVIKKGDE